MSSTYFSTSTQKYNRPLLLGESPAIHTMLLRTGTLVASARTQVQTTLHIHLCSTLDLQVVGRCFLTRRIFQIGSWDCLVFLFVRPRSISSLAILFLFSKNQSSLITLEIFNRVRSSQESLIGFFPFAARNTNTPNPQSQPYVDGPYTPQKNRGPVRRCGLLGL